MVNPIMARVQLGVALQCLEGSKIPWRRLKSTNLQMYERTVSPQICSTRAAPRAIDGESILLIIVLDILAVALLALVTNQSSCQPARHIKVSNSDLHFSL